MHILASIFLVLLVHQYGCIKGPAAFAGSWLLGLILGIVLFIFGFAFLLAVGSMIFR